MALHNTLFAHNHKHSSNFFDINQSGVILAKTENLISSMFQLFGNLRAFIIPLISSFITISIILLNVSLSLGFTLIALNIINSFISYLIYKKIKSYIKNTTSKGSKTMGIIADSIANARLVKSTASIFHEKKLLRHYANDYIKTKKQESHITGLSNLQSTLLITLFMVLNLSVIIAYYYLYNLSLENIILTITLAINLSNNSFNIAEIFDKTISLKAKIEDALELLYRPFDITDIPNAKKLKLKNNSISFKNVTFQYNKDTPLFNKLNLNINPNEKIGLVGLSGSGKSTLIKLLLRSYDINKGKITISNQDISKVTLEANKNNQSAINSFSKVATKSDIQPKENYISFEL